jgi:hypothetical protein
LLVSFGKSEWHWSREVFRLDASGTLIKKYGSGEPKGDISGDPDGCGDGLCLATSMNDIQVYDGAGEKVGSVSLREQTKLANIHIASIVDVPGKGVYALLGYLDDKKKGRAELIRLDGIY